MDGGRGEQNKVATIISISPAHICSVLSLQDVLRVEIGNNKLLVHFPHRLLINFV